MEANSDRLEPHFIPPYPPEFHPIENLWRLTKGVTTHNRHFATLQDLQTRLFRRFNRYQGNPASLRGLFKSLLQAA